MERYKGVTLLELLIVMAVMFVLSLISVISYRSLVDSFSINEVSLTIAQDIRTTQRAAMLLDRGGDERWLHGIGIDFRDIEEREYHIFKWCSEFDYYDQTKPTLTGEVPNLPFGQDPDFAYLDYDVEVNSCSRDEEVDEKENAYYVIETKNFSTYDNLDFWPESNVSFILFESVSGKAFFYDEDGFLLNYGISAGELFLLDPVELFNLRLEPMRAPGLSSRNITVVPVSGIAYFEYED